MKRVIRNKLLDTETATRQHQVKHDGLIVDFYKTQSGMHRFAVLKFTVKEDLHKVFAQDDPKYKDMQAMLSAMDKIPKSWYGKKQYFALFEGLSDVEACFEHLPGEAQYEAYVKCGLRVD